ncbi:hypothetical protein SpiBuddy_2333 [Sphaerochaeta globosa str. Buddy]|uniref:Uncharacterized protein n=1 Tax=Sphaerochaeta globosa (strain ATCC BAA-1886 / DSM 22777 / Buddy) TaxID=158189 RepID=F0RRC8_SPHGB|nr:hypothetical protein SpiBuddy_2333 [Sphaerochaeta globosa str. Buddy]
MAFRGEKTKQRVLLYSIQGARIHHPVAGVLSGIFLRIGKKYGNHKAPGNIWSWGDLLADALGVVAGGVLFWQLYYVWFFVSLRMALGSIVLYL